jgi:hypothetical protein
MSSDRPTAYVPGFEHDVFISYAHTDDIPDPGQQGWVSSFCEHLKNRLMRLLGRPDCFSVWWDGTNLDGTRKLTPGLETPLKKTAVMIAVLSNGYLASSWCKREREVFLEVAGSAAGDYSRIFVVEPDCLVEPDKRPKEFADNLSYRFWAKGPLDKYPRPFGSPPDADYKSRIDALARDLVEVLKGMKQRAQDDGHPVENENAKNGTDPLPPARPRPVVYLAETTEDLEPLWWKVKGYLEQQQIAVVPKQYLPRDPEAFRQAVDSNLADASLFVQLLSKVPGRRMDESRTYVTFQNTCAREAGLSVLQWRDSGLSEQDLAGVEWPAHRELLDGADVQAVHIEEFKQEIVKTLERLQAKREKEARIAQRNREVADGNDFGKVVFVVADPKDGTIAQSIYDYILGQGFGCALPATLEDRPDEFTPADIRRDFEDNLRLADGTVIVWGQTPATWYRSQLIEVRKLHAQCRPKEKRCRVGLFLGPPPPKNPRTELPGMHLIPGKEGVDEKAFQPFLDALLEGVPQGQGT